MVARRVSALALLGEALGETGRAGTIDNGLAETLKTQQMLEKFMPPEGAFALSKWNFLSKSFAELGAKTKDVIQVREDLKAMANDVKTQHALWQTGEASLNQENLALETDLKKLRQSNEGMKQWIRLNGTLDESVMGEQITLNQIVAERKTRDEEWQKQYEALSERIAQLAERSGKLEEEAKKLTDQSASAAKKSLLSVAAKSGMAAKAGKTQSSAGKSESSGKGTSGKASGKTSGKTSSHASGEELSVLSMEDTAVIESARFELADLVSQEKQLESDEAIHDKYSRVKEKLEAEIAALEKDMVGDKMPSKDSFKKAIEKSGRLLVKIDAKVKDLQQQKNTCEISDDSTVAQKKDGPAEKKKESAEGAAKKHAPEPADKKEVAGVEKEEKEALADEHANGVVAVGGIQGAAASKKDDMAGDTSDFDMSGDTDSVVESEDTSSAAPATPAAPKAEESKTDSKPAEKEDEATGYESYEEYSKISLVSLKNTLERMKSEIDEKQKESDQYCTVQQDAHDKLANELRDRNCAGDIW